MTTAPTFLAIDLSATSIDLALVSKEGEIIDVVARHIQRGDNGAQDPQDWWRAVRTGVKDLMRRSKVRKDDIRAVAITSDDRGLVCADSAGKALTPVYLGAQQPPGDYQQRLTTMLGARNMVNLVGGLAFPGCTASLVPWVQEEHPRQWHDCVAIMNPRNFLGLRFTDQLVTDSATAAASCLFNPRSGSWSKMVLDRLKIPAAWLPSINPGHRLGGRVTPAAARETGLSPGTPVATGSNRNACLAIAAGAVNHGDAIIQLGDDGNIFGVQNAWQKPQGQGLEIGCHTFPEQWALIMRGVALDTAIDWYTNELAAAEVQQWRRAGRTSMDAIAELAAEVPPGASGLHFLFDNGPGGMLGMTTEHRRQHVMRALLEDVGYRIGAAMTTLEANNAQLDRIHIIGRGAGCHLWCQIISDICNRELTAIEREHPSLTGCGILAAAAIGSYKTPGAIAKRTAAVHHSFAPRRPAVEIYQHEHTRRQQFTTALNEFGHFEER